jgi:hypothetical protein
MRIIGEGDEGDGEDGEFIRAPGRKNMTTDNQASLFGDPVASNPDRRSQGEEISSVEEVFDLARQHFGLPAPATPGDPPEEVPSVIAELQRRRLEKAAELGLVARWADYKTARGYVAIHDPSSGEWCAVPWKAAPSWARWEAVKRSELYRAGDAGAFDLTAAQMEVIWQRERPSLEEEGIVEEYDLPDD